MMLLTASRLKDERACSRLGKYKYRDGMRPVHDGSDALRFGTLFHVALAEWWKAALPGERLDVALAAIEDAAGGSEFDPFDRVRAEELLRGYHFRWEDEPLEPLAVEAEFRAPLINPATGHASRTFELAGKVDAIVREVIEASYGRKLLLEHKTSSEDIGPGSDYRKRLRMDAQISVYYAGAAALGHVVEACIYDVIRKPSIRPYLATPLESRKFTAEKRNKLGELLQASKLYAGQREADETPEEFRARLREDIATKPDHYYQRFEVVRLESELEEAAFDVWQTATIIRDSGTAGRFPRNPDACLRWGRTCAFFAACSGEASIEDPALYVRAELHPELSL